MKNMKSVKSRLCEIQPFINKIEGHGSENTFDKLEVMQVNVGKLCNLSCKHCHVEAGPNRKEIMPKAVMEDCLKAFKANEFKIMDITGGAPEMNPNFEWFIEEASKIAEKIIVRTNIIILNFQPYEHLIEIYKKLKINVVCSLPCYTSENTNAQRGENVFENNIKVLKKLNEVGYGLEKDLELDLVYNPGGAFLSPLQQMLEEAYKVRLKEDYDIVFNNLFTITNMPIGRFKIFLEETGEFDGYMRTLSDSFNEKTLKNMMCRNQISVGWNGNLYDCDFNQAKEMPICTKETIKDYVHKKQLKRKISFADHCYACTAGQGSSCCGATE